MTTEVLKQHVADCCEVLVGVVPESELNDCYLAAARSPDKRPGPISGDDLLRAYQQIQAAKSGVVIRKCEFCRMHLYDSTQYPRCPFHSGAQEELSNVK